MQRYNFEISRKGTIGSLYQIVSTQYSQNFSPRPEKTVKMQYDNYQYIDIAILKSNTIISDIDNGHVYNLANGTLFLSVPFSDIGFKTFV
jgi:hypothetical protein